MYRTDDTEILNRSKYNLPAVALQRRALLSLSWYSSVPKAGAHLTLSRVSAPRAGGGPSSIARVWLASRRKSADPRSAWRIAPGNRSGIRVTGAELTRDAKGKRLHLGSFLENEGLGTPIAQHSPQDAHSTACGGHAGNPSRFGDFELVAVIAQGRLVEDQGGQSIHQSAAKIDVADLDDLFALTFALASARVVTPGDQATTTKDLGGILIMSRIADGSSQASDLRVAETLELSTYGSLISRAV